VRITVYGFPFIAGQHGVTLSLALKSIAFLQSYKSFLFIFVPLLLKISLQDIIYLQH
jgi:hypothetical protein